MFYDVNGSQKVSCLINADNMRYKDSMTNKAKKQGKEINEADLMPFGERLLIALKLRKMNQTELGKKIKTSQANISKLMRTSDDGGSTVWKMARALDVDVGWLSEGIGPEPTDKKVEKGKIPLIEWGSILENKSNNKNYVPVEINFPNEDKLFATKIPDWALISLPTSIFSSNDYLIISPERKPTNGEPILFARSKWLAPEYAIYTLTGDKKGYKYPGESRPRKMPKDAKICGVIIGRLNSYIPI